MGKNKGWTERTRAEANFLSLRYPVADNGSNGEAFV